jgi:hypothetical protein
MSQAIDTISGFRAVYCSGLCTPDRSLLTALTLLFERIYFPNCMHLLRQTRDPETARGSDEKALSLDAKMGVCLLEALRELHTYRDLIPNVIESELFDGKPCMSGLIRTARILPNGQLEPYEVMKDVRWDRGGEISFILDYSDGSQEQASIFFPPAKLHTNDTIPSRINSGYFPVVMGPRGGVLLQADSPPRPSTRQLAALLAERVLALAIPKTIAAEPEIILAARDKLSSQLPPFWAAMLRLSTRLRETLAAHTPHQELTAEAQDIVDTEVLPRLIDLRRKMEMDRSAFFYRILAPAKREFSLLLSTPSLSLGALVASGLRATLGMTFAAAGKFLGADKMDQDAGLTYVLNVADTLVSAKQQRGKNS